MKINIHTGSAFFDSRTGVDEYTYQLLRSFSYLKHDNEFNLYVSGGYSVDFSVSDKFVFRVLNFPFFWTLFRLSLEVFFKKPNNLFIPANFLPIIYPEKTVVTIHGLEFEYFPKHYSKKDLYNLRFGTKRVIRRADKIITVSENTKKDLIELYGANPENIFVVYHGVDIPKNINKKNVEKYIFYIGRIETKKNLIGIIKAFDIAKKIYKIPHKLYLAGGRGYGFGEVKKIIDNSKFKNDIKLLGYVSVERKKELYENADMFLFPSFYEGFGMPILEAQAYDVPVITSNCSSMPEIAGDGALFVSPDNEREIAEAIKNIYFDKSLRLLLVKKGRINARKYSWEKCAKETLKILNKTFE